MTLGEVRGAAVRLHPAAPHLVVAEGIETTPACIRAAVPAGMGCDLGGEPRRSHGAADGGAVGDDCRRQRCARPPRRARGLRPAGGPRAEPCGWRCQTSPAPTSTMFCASGWPMTTARASPSASLTTTARAMRRRVRAGGESLGAKMRSLERLPVCASGAAPTGSRSFRFLSSSGDAARGAYARGEFAGVSAMGDADISPRNRARLARASSVGCRSIGRGASPGIAASCAGPGAGWPSAMMGRCIWTLAADIAARAARGQDHCCGLGSYRAGGRAGCLPAGGGCAAAAGARGSRGEYRRPAALRERGRG